MVEFVKLFLGPYCKPLPFRWILKKKLDDPILVDFLLKPCSVTVTMLVHHIEHLD
jgi:hypothetical protein